MRSISTEKSDVFDAVAKLLAGDLSRRATIKLAIKAMTGAALAELGVKPLWADTCYCGDLLFDSSTQCCTSAGIRPKNPMPSMALCPNRVAHSGHTPSSNGCGGQDSWSGTLVPSGWGAADFTPCCNMHDECYDTCNTSKTSCDSSFFACMATACDNAYDPAVWIQQNADCYTVAVAYWSAVNTFGGSFYDAAQIGACDCCGSSCSDVPCTPGNCSVANACNGSSICGCLPGYDRATQCVQNISCMSTTPCSSDAQCPWGRVCVSNTCCGSGGWCAPPCGGGSGARVASTDLSGTTLFLQE